MHNVLSPDSRGWVSLLIHSIGGGTGFSGPSTCVSGYTCTFSNQYYSQCLPGSPAGNPSTTATGGVPVTTTAGSTPGTTTTGSSPGTTPAPVVGNPFSGVGLYANPYYASEISTLAIPSLTGPMATKAAAVAKVGTFVWL